LKLNLCFPLCFVDEIGVQSPLHDDYLGIYGLNIKLYESDIVSVYIIVLATVRWVFTLQPTDGGSALKLNLFFPLLYFVDFSG
jgi:hypothetical protein